MPSSAAKWRGYLARNRRPASRRPRGGTRMDAVGDSQKAPRTGYPLGGGSNAVAANVIPRNTTSQGRNFPGGHSV